MRKALLAVTLVAASFAGGAVVNGPGLAWVCGLLGLDPARVVPVEAGALSPRVEDQAAGGELDAPRAVDVPVAPSPTPSDAAAEAAESLRPSPVPLPTERSRGPTPERAEAASTASTPDETKPPSPEAARSGTSLVPPSPLLLEGAPPLEPPASAQTASAPPPPSTESPQTAPSSSATKTSPTASMTPDSPKKTTQDPGWSDVPGSAPAAAALPRPQDVTPKTDPALSRAALPLGEPAQAGSDKTQPAGASSTDPKPVAAGSGSWTDLGRRLKAMGVTRYWIDGDLNGRARFRCVIPLAGQHAVGQQFEAEADDAATAAEITLRRIILWKATEAP